MTLTPHTATTRATRLRLGWDPGGIVGVPALLGLPRDAANHQFWYRAPTDSCSGAGLDSSNAWTVTWLPLRLREARVEHGPHRGCRQESAA